MLGARMAASAASDGGTAARLITLSDYSPGYWPGQRDNPVHDSFHGILPNIEIDSECSP